MGNKNTFEEKALFNRKELVQKITSDRTSLSDDELVKLLLSYVFKGKELEQVWSKTKETVSDISFLFDVDAMCMLYGKKDENVLAFFKALKRIKDLAEKPVIKLGNVYSLDEIGRIFTDYIGNELVENLCVAFIGGDDRMIGMKKYSNFEMGRVRADTSDMVREALSLDAKKVVIAHNHSSGNAQHQRSDFELTKIFGTDLNSAGIILEEHFVITKNSYVGLLNRTEA
jgi:DNA repair protein RadC